MRVVYSALQQPKDADCVLADAPPALPSDCIVFVNETSAEENNPEKDSGQEPDWHPPLAPVCAMAAAAPSTEEILQTACKKAAANISHFLPLSYTSSYSSSDFDEETIPPTDLSQKGLYRNARD